MEPKDRLKQAMKIAGYENPTDAWKANERALKAGRVGKDLLISNANGNRDVSKNAAATYAKVFGRSAAWYLFGQDDAIEPRGSYDIPLVSMVSAGRMRDQASVMPADIEKHIHLDDLPKGNWIALTVEGDSMNRIAPEGSLLIVNRADNTLIDGKYYIFSLDGGEATFKTYRRSPAPERLQPYSTNPDHMSIALPRDADLYVFGRVRKIIQDV